MKVVPHASPRIWKATLTCMLAIQLLWMGVLFRLSCGIISSAFTHAFGNVCGVPSMAREARFAAWELIGTLGWPSLAVVPALPVGVGIARARPSTLDRSMAVALPERGAQRRLVERGDRQSVAGGASATSTSRPHLRAGWLTWRCT